ncbi:MAG TPA: TIGR03557 family F420-dependent LLM class oxidoreductase [Ktedonobacteraceae bacterium]|nr:TIGR03557 family F420-dependent LLM class oxidoreductase [Ktedonobacteraceae bacterium]
MLQLGWKAGPEQYPPSELLDYAIVAEQAGFDTIDSSDHFNPWSVAGQASFVWTWFGAVAARTSKIHMGTGVTCPILRYNPAIIAQAAATVSSMAPDRFFLSVGTGEALNEYAATGMWPEYDERQDMLAEAIDLIRMLWSGEEVTYDGTYYETQKAKLFTPPASPIPLYVSSLVPDSADFAGEYGDGLMTVGGKEPEEYKQLLQKFDEAARNEGKDPSKMPKLIELNVAYTQDKDAAIECQKKYWAGTFIPALFDQKIYTPQMSAQNGKSVGSDTIMKMCCISGNAEDHIKYAQQFIDLGFTTLFFHSAGPDQRAFLQNYGRDVLPQIRSKNGVQQSQQTTVQSQR